ncbi:UbiA family prenyltransferase [Halobellus litoreus]|uniref:UbiA family prenyltransferase n=1 Tax=Halobellus litoreus TaxID=755310 RepID=A0ABD6DTU3_9EURY|nr:UbiA family prenyltransferase [Halobellus litoreus]
MTYSRRGTGRVRRTTAAYAELVRVPNLFTAPPDVIAGAALAVAAGGAVALPAVAGVAAASVLLYAAGTALNDFFDAPVDAEERPERPIPAGRVPRSAAGALGGVLLLCAVLLAAATAGADAGIGAVAVAAAVVGYDGALKGGPAGFLAMGAARGLNVLLGTTATDVPVASLPPWALAVPVAVAAYVAGVTLVAADEATGATRRSVVVAGGGAGVAGAVAVTLLATVGPTASVLAVGVGVALALGFLAVTGRALARAYRDPSPGTVGPVIGTCVLALVVLDSAVAAVAGVGWTLATVAFLGPAVGLAQLFDVS